METLKVLPLGEINPDPSQPRQRFDQEALEDLALSILKHGLLQPITVRPTASAGQYEIISGERRYRALTILAQRGHSVGAKCIIKEKLDLKEVRQLQILENVAREDLSPGEEARGYQMLIDLGMEALEIARSVGRPLSTVTTLLKSLQAIPEVVQMMGRGHIKPRLAAALAGLTPDRQRQAVGRLGTNHMDTVQAMMMVERMKAQESQPAMIPEQLTASEVETTKIYRSAFSKACEAINAVLEQEARKPGSLSKVLDTQKEDEAIGLLIGSLNKLRWALRREQAGLAISTEGAS